MVSRYESKKNNNHSFSSSDWQAGNSLQILVAYGNEIYAANSRYTNWDGANEGSWSFKLGSNVSDRIVLSGYWEGSHSFWMGGYCHPEGKIQFGAYSKSWREKCGNSSTGQMWIGSVYGNNVGSNNSVVSLWLWAHPMGGNASAYTWARVYPFGQ